MYYALYRSAVTGKSGCVKQFTSVPQDTPSFPARVAWDCPLCKVSHLFNYDRTFLVATPKHTTHFVTYCVENNIDQDIVLTP